MKVSPRFPMMIVLVAMVAALWLAPGAEAAVTGSQLSAPASPTFKIWDNEAPSELTVSGTTTGGAEGEKIDLRCYSNNGESVMFKENVTLVAGGTISTTLAQPGPPITCRLLAVPAGTEPGNLSTYSGPIVALGESDLHRIENEFNEGVASDFYLNDQQLTAADDYNSIGSCGLADGYLKTEKLESIPTFFCNDWFEYENEDEQPATSGFRVDGENAYFSYAAEQIEPEGEGLPEVEYSYRQDPVNGNVTLSDNETASFCELGIYPPTSSRCEVYLESGVRDERTIEQSHDGHLVLITDNFVSTDGKAHEVEALPENEQDFNEHGEDIEYKFPGESGYQLREDGEEVAFAGTSPSVVYVKVAGAPDGDQETGRAAIVAFQESSPARFNEFALEQNSFYFENAVTVPASGSATLKYAYVQAFNQAEVEALVEELLNPTPPAPPAPPTPPVTPTTTTTTTKTTSPSNSTTPAQSTATFRIRKIKHLPGSSKLKVAVTGAGKFQLTGKRVESSTLQVSGPGIAYLSVVPDAALKTLLSERGVVHVAVKVQFKGTAGGARTKWKKLSIQLAP